MKISALVYTLILINQIQSESSSNDGLNLCYNSTDVSYENYTDAVTQNCGCEQNTCVRKCCQKGFLLSHHEDADGVSYKGVCSKHESLAFSVPIYDGQQKIRNATESFLIGMLNCHYTNLFYIRMDETNPYTNFYIQRNGSLYYPHHHLMLSNERYCIDEGDRLSAYLCFQQIKSPESGTKMETMIHVAAKLISLPFLLVTGVVYALLPKRNLHRTALMIHAFSLLVGNALIAFGQYTVIEDNNLCISLGYSILLFMVASFFWMNVMCIDIWLTLSCLRDFYQQKKVKRRIFMVAFLYAWGLPILNVLIVLLLNSYGDEDANYHPGIGVESCFLKNGLPTISFYFGPILILIIINIVLFVLTAMDMQKLKKRNVENSQNKRSYKRKDKFKLYWKLLFVMGLNPVVNTHVIQLISWAVGRQWDRDVVVYVWYYKDFAHASYGILLFLIFVCQKKIWILLKKRIRHICKCNKNDSKISATTSTISSSSNSDPPGIPLKEIQSIAKSVP